MLAADGVEAHAAGGGAVHGGREGAGFVAAHYAHGLETVKSPGFGYGGQVVRVGPAEGDDCAGGLRHGQVGGQLAPLIAAQEGRGRTA